MRTETEWVETLHDNWNIVTGPDPVKILEAVLSEKPHAHQRKDFGTGKSATVIAETLMK